MAAKVGDFVMPGDIACVDQSGVCLLGPGLRGKNDIIYATIPGILRENKPALYWVDSRQKRYVQAEGDRVLGVVTSKPGGNYKVDIGSHDLAVLCYLSFEGSSKKNRPNIEVGDLVYGRISIGDNCFEPELVCIDSTGKSGGMGVISNGGNMIRLSVSYARRLLSANDKILKTLSNTFQYEITIGENGWIWVKGQDVLKTLSLTRALIACEKTNSTNLKEIIRTASNFR
ncbi:hypothetical protein HELRODRAFT_90168 [Helobdella robusta]|uniref:Ribosomal RNA-processing protein 40 n=1 Tax=Helobdella robusta TaxID=6412 RepID=T1G7L8_HELRO|nr:hypothetical protein HELRODRAFT_90168 [Helobdella robusta]ESN91952.1 hypothetical protein HELRODRAFT_90168 [Helobdella robusta]